jgi:hypothetical protein
VVKQKLALKIFDDDKTDQITRHFYAACAVSIEATKKSFARTPWVKSSNSFKALAHGLKPDGHQIFQVVIGSCA